MRVTIDYFVDFDWSVLLSEYTNGVFGTSQPLTHLANVGDGGRDSNYPHFLIQAHYSADYGLQSGSSFLIVQHVNLVNQQQSDIFEVFQVLPR